MATPSYTTSHATDTILLMSELPFSDLHTWVYSDNAPLPPQELSTESVLGWPTPGPFDYLGDPTAMASQDAADGYGETGQTLRMNVATTADHEEARWAENLARALAMPVVIPAAAPIPPLGDLPQGSAGPDVVQPGGNGLDAGAAAGHAAAGSAPLSHSDDDLPAAFEPSHGVDMPNGEFETEVGHLVQQNNNITPPRQPQDTLAGTSEPTTSATRAVSDARQGRKRTGPPAPSVAGGQKRTLSVASGAAGPSRKRSGPPTAASEDRDRAAKRQKTQVGGDAEGEGNGSPGNREIPKDRVIRLCAERSIDLAVKPWTPIPCFACAERRAAEGKPPVAKPTHYRNRGAFERHLEPCSTPESEWPICYFCGKRRNAPGRPDQMARHVMGLWDYCPCSELQDMIAGGIETKGMLADWLKENGHEIDKEHLGENLALALDALDDDPVCRDEWHGIELRDPAEKRTRNGA